MKWWEPLLIISCVGVGLLLCSVVSFLLLIVALFIIGVIVILKSLQTIFNPDIEEDEEE